MFDLDRFLVDCQDALTEGNPMLAVKAAVERAVRERLDLDRVFGPFRKGGTTVLHHAPELTVLHIVWPPGIDFHPHDHRMWAVIGVHAGIEDNTFYRRCPGGLEQAGFKRLEPGDTRVLAPETIHAVANPERMPTAALHVYGGDFFRAQRSEFEPGTFEERPFDLARAGRVFEDANRRWEAVRTTNAG